MTNTNTLPNLAGIVKKDDVFKKGGGSYAADYVSWARIADYLHEHANGFEFHLQMAPNEEGYVWKAPDGTGYVVGYFAYPNESDFTAPFPFPCMDNRNMPVPFEKVSCRVLTDTHRRALCATAAFTFGLGFELWAKAEVAEAEAPEPAAKKAPAKKATPKPAPAPAPAAAPAATDDDAPLTEDQRKELFAGIQAAPEELRKKLVADFIEAFNITGDKISTAITAQKHWSWIQTFLQLQPL